MKTRILLAVLSALFLLASPAVARDIFLEWTDNATNEDGFQIEKAVGRCVSTTGAVFTPLAKPGPNVVSYSDTAIAEQTTYCYRISATNAAGVSAFSNTLEVTVPPFTVPATPTNLRGIFRP